MQRTEKRPTARRATAGLAVANFSERNNGDGRLSARPQGAHPIGQCGDAYRDVGNEREHAYREVGGTSPWMDEVERSRSQSGEQCREQLPRDAVALPPLART